MCVWFVDTQIDQYCCIVWWLLFRANFSILVVLKYDPHQLHHPHRGGEATGRFRQSSTTGAQRGGLSVRCIRKNYRNESPCHKSIAQTKRFLARSTNQRAPTWMRKLGCWTDRRALICHRHRMGQKDGDSMYRVCMHVLLFSGYLGITISCIPLRHTHQ